MKKAKLLLPVLALALGSTVAQADLLVDFGYNTNYVTGIQNSQGLTGGYVPFSMSSARSPVASTNYLGPVYYGGATGNIPVTATGWAVQNSATISDYISCSGTSTGVGSRVVALIMFTNQSCTITQMTWSMRLGGTSGNQTNKVSFVVRKTDGSFYISEQFSDKGSIVKTNGNLSALAWYNYDPNTDIDAKGSLASGLTLSDVDAVGEWQDARTTALVQMGIGINGFRAWGTTAALKNIEASPGSLNITEGTTNSFSVRLSSLPDNSVTVSVSRVSGDTSLVVLPDPTVLVFDTANWNVGQPVNVEAISDVDTNSGIATVACTDLGGTYNTRNVPVTQIDTTVVAAVAGFNGAPALGYAPLAVTFTDTSSGTITNRFWDFGDGSTTNTMATSISHTYTVAGSTSSVQLTVSGPLGDSTTNRLDFIRVLPGIPPALPIYDAFNDSVSNSAIPTGWFCLAPGVNAAHSRIDAGSLSYTGLKASEGNSFGLGNKTDDYSLMFTSPTLGTNETIYFSTLLRFNNTSNMNSGALRLLDSADPFGSGIEVGFGVTNNESVMGFCLDNRNRVWNDATPVRTPASYTAAGVTYLIVASYTRGTTATNGLLQLWINPDSATFGTATPPAAILTTNSYASDAAWNRLDIISAGSGSWPTNWQMDEVRIATSWAAVVPAFSAPVADADSDGLPDDWETLYFGSSTGADPSAVCSNGVNTVIEAYVAGLDPNDPQSLFRAEVLPATVLNWNAVSGRVYSIYWTTNLMNSFQLVATNIPWTQSSFTNPAAVPAGYYKIAVQIQ